MFAKLFLLFAILPIVEIAFLINVGEILGGWNTVAIVIVTAFIGAQLVRQQGMNTLATAQKKMSMGEMPGQELAEGLLLLVAGVLLVTPGFITDGIGFLFSMPLTRPAIAKSLVRQFGHKIVMQQAGGNPFQQQHAQHHSFQDQGFQHQESQHREPQHRKANSQSPQGNEQQEFQQARRPQTPAGEPGSKGDHTIIEGEYQRKDD